MNKNVILAALFAVTMIRATEGEVCVDKNPCVKNPCDECPGYSGAITLGYDSDYIWRGLQFAEENWWVDVNYTFDLSCFGNGLGDLTLGLWSLNENPGAYEETRLYVNYALPCPILGFDVTLDYVNYSFGNGIFNGPDDVNEAGASISRDVLGIGVTYYVGWLDYNNPEGAEEWFHNLSFGRSIAVTDCISLEFESGATYWESQLDEGFAYRYTTVSLPVSIGCQLTITPYVSYIDTNAGGPTHRDVAGAFSNGTGFSPDDRFYGGVSASWAF